MVKPTLVSIVALDGRSETTLWIGDNGRIALITGGAAPRLISR